jgi:hypothetical protein
MADIPNGNQNNGPSSNLETKEFWEWTTYGGAGYMINNAEIWSGITNNSFNARKPGGFPAFF